MGRFWNWTGKNARWLMVLLFFLLGLLLSLGAFLQAGWNDRENLSRWSLYARFDPDANDAPGSDQYLDGVPMEEMDFPALGFSLAIAPLGFDPYTLSVTLPQDIVYYREVNGLKVPALTLSKGSEISFYITDHTIIPYGYGYLTFPTYERGWRYAAPFEVDGEDDYLRDWGEESILSQEEADFYYVKLEDIELIYQLLIADRPIAEEIDPREMERRILINLLQVDGTLRWSNIYISPDVQAAILSPWNLFAFLIAFLLMLAAAILLFCGPAKRKSPAAYRVTNPSFEALLVWSGNNRRLLSVLLLIFSALALVTASVRQSWELDQANLRYKFTAQTSFDPDENDVPGSKQYLEGFPMEEMDFRALDFSSETGRGLGFAPYTLQITLTEDLVYYQEVAGIKIPALTLPAGSLISYYMTPAQSSPYGYGYKTYPTYDRNWRYAVPFETGEEGPRWKGEQARDYILSQEDADFYYVRLEDIDRVYRQLADAYIAEEEIEAEPAEIEWEIYLELFRMDNLFIADNIYLSPDSGSYAYTRREVYGLLGGGCSFLAGLALLISSRRRLEAG